MELLCINDVINVATLCVGLNYRRRLFLQKRGLLSRFDLPAVIQLGLIDYVSIVYDLFHLLHVDAEMCS